MPFSVRSSFGNDIATFVDSGLTIRNGAGITFGGVTRTSWPAGGSGSDIAINGSGTASNIVDTSSVTWNLSNGVARATSVAPIFNGLMMCDDDSTSHTVYLTKLGTNYLLSVSQDLGAPGPYPSVIPLAASDLTVHQLKVKQLGTNYLLEITQ